MSLFKARSKSTGRSPSRSEHELDLVGERAKTPREGEPEAEDENDLIDRLEILGSLTDKLDSKKIDGRELDKVVKELFDKYKEQEPIKYNANQFLFFNSCKSNQDLNPPKTLQRATKKMDLDRISKLQRLFSAIPIFNNDPAYTIREFLLTLNNTAEHLGGEVGPKMTEAEFELILNSKLSPRVKSTISSYKSETLSGLYSNLINLFDESEGKREAFSLIVNGAKKFSNLRLFTEEMLRLLSLSQKKPEEQAELFLHSLETVLPPRIAEKVADYADTYSAMSGGKAPPLPKIVDFIYRWKGEIDAFMSKKNKPGHGFNYAGTNGPLEENRTTETRTSDIPKEERYCSTCNRKGHTNEFCFKTSTCVKCGVTGHIAKFCKNKDVVCARCGRVGHIQAQCTTRCRMCNGSTHGTVTCPMYLGEEPSRVPCQHCMDLVNLKLYHPSSKCIVVNRSSKN